MSNRFKGALTLNPRPILPHNDVPQPKRAARAFGQVEEFARNPRKHAKLFFSRLRLLFRLVRDPQTPWTAKLAASLCISYVVSPIQLIPNFIPVIGQMDDVVAIWLAMKAIQRCTPSAILAKHTATPNRATLITDPPSLIVPSVSEN